MTNVSEEMFPWDYRHKKGLCPCVTLKSYLRKPDAGLIWYLNLLLAFCTAELNPLNVKPSSPSSHIQSRQRPQLVARNKDVKYI